MDLKILEPIKNFLKEFNSPEEFNVFYTKNKEELDNLTTHKLNKMYHIIGYRITKIKGELMLKKWTEKEEKEEPKNYDEQIQTIQDEIEKIKLTINKIIDFINQPK